MAAAPEMKLFAIMRRRAWATPTELQAGAKVSSEVGKQMENEVRWIRSYVLGEANGSVGTVCIYEAVSEDAIRKHAQCACLACDEVVPIADTVIVRPDPAKKQ